jgi:hypothetical protein
VEGLTPTTDRQDVGCGRHQLLAAATRTQAAAAVVAAAATDVDLDEVLTFGSEDLASLE